MFSLFLSSLSPSIYVVFNILCFYTHTRIHHIQMTLQILFVGADFDHCLASIIKDKISETKVSETNHLNLDDYVIRLKSNKKEDKDDLYPCSDTCIMSLAENIKKILSHEDGVRLFLQLNTTTNKEEMEEGDTSAVSTTTSSDGVSSEVEYDISISRFEFEDKCSSLFDRVMMPIDDLLNEALMPKTEVIEP